MYTCRLLQPCYCAHLFREVACTMSSFGVNSGTDATRWGFVDLMST